MRKSPEPHRFGIEEGRGLGWEAFDVVLVSGDALVTRPTGTQVAQVMGGDTIHFQGVQLGRDFGVQTEILSGLAEGDMVVLNPTDDIRDGSKVRPVQQRPKPAPSPAPTQGKR